MDRVLGLAIGLVFGVILCWSGMSSPEVIQGALLFKQSYLYFFMFSAVAVATIGTRLLAKRGAAEPPVRELPQRRHIVGALVFGAGWGVACACPGPILTQLGQGIGWAVFTCAGVVTGIYVFHRTSPVAQKAPARDDMEFAPSQPESV